jgi:hypothetical protein
VPRHSFNRASSARSGCRLARSCRSSWLRCAAHSAGVRLGPRGEDRVASRLRKSFKPAPSSANSSCLHGAADSGAPLSRTGFLLARAPARVRFNQAVRGTPRSGRGDPTSRRRHRRGEYAAVARPNLIAVQRQREQGLRRASELRSARLGPATKEVRDEECPRRLPPLRGAAALRSPGDAASGRGETVQKACGASASATP